MSPFRLHSLVTLTLLTLPHIPALANTQFTDWTTIDLENNIATGTVAGTAVTFAGFDIDYGVTNGTETIFNSPNHTPPLAASDVVGFRGATPANQYTVTFDDPVRNVIIHLYSLASTLRFHGDTDLVRLSGEPEFAVSSNTITGVARDTSDASGTALLPGRVKSFTFSAQYASEGDGIYIQIGATPRLRGDTNDDGVVDLTDLNNVLNNFGDTGASPGDDNADNLVDLTDLNNVLNNFGATAATTALSPVPEPSMLVCLFAAFPLVRRRRS